MKHPEKLPSEHEGNVTGCLPKKGAAGEEGAEKMLSNDLVIKLTLL